jgi:predicted dehydrogenase
MFVLFNTQVQEFSQMPIRFAIAGLTHGHSAFILGRKSTPDFKLAGIYEPNRELALRYATIYKFDPNLIYDNLCKMLDSVKPEAVCAFGSVYDHMSVIEASAARESAETGETVLFNKQTVYIHRSPE